MSSKCKVPGCEKLNQQGKEGMCCSHYTAFRQSPPEEKKPVEKKPRAKRFCNVEGCDKSSWRGSKCWMHHPDHAGKKVPPEAPVVVTDDLDGWEAAGWVAKDPDKKVVVTPSGLRPPSKTKQPVVYDLAEELPADFGKVVNGDGAMVPFGTDAVIVQALREAWAGKEAEWLVELSGLKPARAICFAASMVKAVESLGY